MKSNLTNLVTVCMLLALSSFSNVTYGQLDINTTNDAAQSSVTFSFLQSSTATIQSTSAAIALDLEEQSFSTLVSDGFYYDSGTNHMYVNTTYDAKYTRVEIVSLDTKEHLFDASLGHVMTATEITDLPSGTYKFIFTNEAGNISVDEINVMSIKRTPLLLANHDD